MNPHNMTMVELLQALELYNNPVANEVAKRFANGVFVENEDSTLPQFLHYIHEMSWSLKEIMQDIEDYELDLSEFLSSDWFDGWRADHFEQLSLQPSHWNSDRAERMHEAAEHGCDGSTHGEAIDDMRKAIDAAERQGKVGPFTAKRLQAEVEGTYNWHKLNGTLDQQIG